jgi:tRNA threonylcarbamoyladenosine biosynthesis protein TsaE
MLRTIDIPDLAATEAFGRRLGELLFPGAVVALVGPLGAGKTHLVRAVAEGLGVKNPAAVTSPTFVLIQEYPARLPVYHFDAYRLNGPREFADLGVDEYFAGDGVCLVEWADKVEPTLPAEHLRVTITVVDESRRRFELAAAGDRYEELVRDVFQGLAPLATVRRPSGAPSLEPRGGDGR